MRATKRQNAVVGLALAAAVTSGCSTPADPSAGEPQPMFTSDAEAFTAAEETLRAYIAAANQVVLSDPATFEAMFAHTTGAFNASERKSLSALHASGARKVGTESLTLSAGREIDQDRFRMSLAVCLDVSGIEMFDADGMSTVSASRPTEQSLLVEFESAPDAGALLIAHMSGREGAPTCVR